MSGERNHINERISRLDAIFLWVASLSGLGFTVFVSNMGLPIVLYLPIFILIFYSIVVGYVGGAIFYDSFTMRIRGWIYLLLGVSIYLPAAIIRFLESHIKTVLPNIPIIIPLIQMVLGLLIPLAYVILNFKFAIPKIYPIFETPLGAVTMEILSRTSFASLCLGAISHVFALSMSNIQANFLSWLLYAFFFLLFMIPMLSEEWYIQKLQKLEKYQDFVERKKGVKRKLTTISLAILFIGVIAFLIQYQFADILPKLVWIILFFLGAYLPIIGFILLLFFGGRDKFTLDSATKARIPTYQLMILESLSNEMSNFAISGETTYEPTESKKEINPNRTGKSEKGLLLRQDIDSERIRKKYPKDLFTRYLEQYPHNPEGVLEWHIHKKLKEGKTREQAIKELQILKAS